jgi:hypothetical protein
MRGPFDSAALRSGNRGSAGRWRDSSRATPRVEMTEGEGVRVSLIGVGAAPVAEGGVALSGEEQDDRSEDDGASC